MNSSELYNLHVGFNQQVFGMRLQLLDGNLETVYDKIVHEFDLVLPVGIYHLKIFYLDYYQEKFFSISGDTNLLLDFGYPLTIPALGFKTTHEYYSKDANRYSLICTNEDLPGPNFLFFAALHDMDKPALETPGLWLSHYSIFNIDKTTVIQFTTENAIFEDSVGKLYFSTILDPGLYFLSYDNNENSRIFPLYIFAHYQTQFFVRYSTGPDFKNSRFFFSSENCFSETGTQYFVLEKILYAFSDFKNFELISDDEMLIIKREPYLVALMNILFSLIESVRNPNHHIAAESPVKDMEQLDLSDIHYCKNEKNEVYKLSNKPPLLTLVMAKYTHQFDNSAIIFEPASILDRIVDNIKCDIFWNNFSKIDEPIKWASAYRPLLQTINEPSNPFVRNIVHAKNSVINYISPQYDNNLRYLVGKTHLAEDQLPSLHETLDKIKSVSDMSKEFGLPPTTILRNYKKYNTYYMQVTEPDPSKRIIPGQGGGKVNIMLLSGALALLIGITFFFNPGFQNITGDGSQPVIITKTTTPVNTTLDDIALFKDQTASASQMASDKNKNDIFLKDAAKMIRYDSPAVTTMTNTSTNRGLLNDTLLRFERLIDLLDQSNSINNEFRKDTAHQYQYAKKLLDVNSRILEMVQADPSYLTNNLTTYEIVSLHNYFEHWIYAYRKKESMSKEANGIGMNDHFKSGDLIPFPNLLRKKIDQAYQDLKNRKRD